MTISLRDDQIRLLRLRAQRLIPGSHDTEDGGVADLVVPRQYAKRVNAGGGILHPTLLVDGCVVATWKGQRKKDSMDLTVEPFDRLSPEIYPALEAETADIARFLGMRMELNIA